jgi:hypothetical protein
MELGLVGFAVHPGAPDHAHPGASEDTHGVGMITATGSSFGVEMSGPGIGVARVAGAGAPDSAPGTPRRRLRSAASALFAGDWKPAMPTLFHAMPQKPLAVWKTVSSVH